VRLLGVAPDVPWSKLPEAQRDAILQGTEATPGRGKKREAYEGIIVRLERLLSAGEPLDPDAEEDAGVDDESPIGSDEIGRFVVTRVCDVCKGKRLRPEALAVRLGDRNIADLGGLPLRTVRSFLSGFIATRSSRPITSSTWALERACAAETSLPKGRRRSSQPIPTA
jgi:excinuclease ABC subunit A